MTASKSVEVEEGLVEARDGERMYDGRTVMVQLCASQLLRGAIVNRTYCIGENLYF